MYFIFSLLHQCHNEHSQILVLSYIPHRTSRFLLSYILYCQPICTLNLLFLLIKIWLDTILLPLIYTSLPDFILSFHISFYSMCIKFTIFIIFLFKIKADYYHAGQTKGDRKMVQSAWLKGEVKVFTCFRVFVFFLFVVFFVFVAFFVFFEYFVFFAFFVFEQLCVYWYTCVRSCRFQYWIKWWIDIISLWTSGQFHI